MDIIANKITILREKIMDKVKKPVKTTRRKFVSGAGIIAASLALRPLSLFAQDEVMTLGLYSAKNYLSEKLISKILTI